MDSKLSENSSIPSLQPEAKPRTDISVVDGIPGAHEEIQDDSAELAFANPRGKHDLSTARAEATRCVDYLIANPSKIAALLARDWQVLSTPYAFEHSDLYQKIAARAHLHVVAIHREEAGGLEHLLFLTRDEGLLDAEYLACIDRDSAPLVVPAART